MAGIFADESPGIPLDMMRPSLAAPFARIRRSYSSKACWEGSFTPKKVKSELPRIFDGFAGVFLEDQAGAVGDKAGLRGALTPYVTLGCTAADEVEAPGESSPRGITVDETAGKMMVIVSCGEALAIVFPVRYSF